MLLTVIQTVVALIGCCASSLRCVYALQQNRYQLTAYDQWLSKNYEHFLKENVPIGIVTALLSWYLPVFLTMFISVKTTRDTISNIVVPTAFIAASFLLAYKDASAHSQRPFVLTKRALRLFGFIVLVDLLPMLICNMFSFPPYIIYAAVPYTVWAAARIVDPIEEKLNAKFYESARKKLKARKKLIRIGITGSAGKTAVKFILRDMLSLKYRVLTTPASFNTPMGISRTINDSLNEKHQIFIAEMGARHVGDIKNLVRLVKPQIGVITSIGDRHLDSFGSIANIADTKFELIKGLPESGMAFFASDNGYTDRLFSLCEREKYAAAVDRPGGHYISATDVRTDETGTHFRLNCVDGTHVPCHTRLLGHYNVQNIALAAAVAKKMNLTMEEIARAIENLQPLEKHLELKSDEKTIIDDTFNTTLTGAAEAMNVLGEMPGRHIVVTAGLPDDDDYNDDTNYAFGAQMRDCADIVILIGRRVDLKPITRGLIDAGFPKGSVQIAADADAAEQMVATLSTVGDTILYEGLNDA